MIATIAGQDNRDSGARQTIVFIHGAGMSKEFWQFQVQGLSSDFNTIAIDLPGHGDSPGPALGRIEAYAQTVRTFISTAGISSPVICGHSMGGAIVQQLLMDNPGLFAAGIMINTGARLKVLPLITETVETDFNAYIDMLKAFAVSPTLKQRDCEERAAPDFQTVMALIETVTGCSPESTLKDFTACNQFDVMEHLDKITDPALVMTAEDDGTTPPKYGQFLANGVRHARLVNICGAGHFSPIEKPDSVNQEIRAFLNDPGLG